MKIEIDLTQEEMDDVMRALCRAEMKKPRRYYRQDGKKWVHCYSCGSILEKPQRFCSACGQKIDWSEE